MKRAFTYIAGRFYEARSNRAFRKYLTFKRKAEKFFARVGL